MRVRDRIESEAGRLTVTERKLAAALLADYPFAGLGPMQSIADRADVSPPSLSRFVAKMGFSGFPAFQQALISELKERSRSPVELHAASRPIAGGYLREFASRAAALTVEAADAIPEAQFERVATLLSTGARRIYLRGGRASDVVAAHLAFHLRLGRSGVRHIPADAESWPDAVLDMGPRDVAFIVDFRRYQPELERLARLVKETRGARIVLLTDKWLSPVARHAVEVLSAPIESGTLWDSYTPAFALAEALAARVAGGDWERTRRRIEDWDALRPDDYEVRP